MRSFVPIASATLLVLTACSSSGPRKLPPLAGDGPDAAVATIADAAAADLPPPASTVRGKESAVFVGEWPDDVRPVNHAGSMISVWARAGSAWKFYGGKGASDGTFVVPDVPAGPFLLHVFNNYFAGSAGRTFDLDYNRLGHPYHLAAGHPTAVTLDLSGLAPWQPTDRLDYFAPAVPAGDWGMEARFASAPTAGTTHLVTNVDYAAFRWNALIDGPGQGDVAFFTQVTTSPGDQGTTYRTATRSFNTSAWRVTDGQPTTVTGTMVEIAPTESLDITFPVATYAALAPAVSPAAGQMTGYYEVLSFPAGDRVGYDSGAGVLFGVYVDARTPSLHLQARYGDPYPRTWGLIANARLFYDVPVPIPGASAPAVVVASFHSSDSAARFTTGDAGPFVTPVRDLRINDAPAFAEREGVTATPTFSWTAPDSGQPSLYMVEVMHAVVAAGKASLQTIAWLYTEETSVAVPPEVLQFGESYVMRVTAEVGAGLSATTPWRWPVHIGWSQCVSARFSP
jgi:hypothetical protein